MAITPGADKAVENIAAGNSTELVTLKTTVALAGGGTLALVAAPAAGTRYVLKWHDFVPSSADKNPFRVGFSATNCSGGFSGINTANALNNFKGGLNVVGGDAQALNVYNDGVAVLAGDLFIQYVAMIAA